MLVPGSFRLLKGAVIVGSDTPNPGQIPFQYNPESVTRSLTPKTVQQPGSGGPIRYAGPPTESISFTIEFDATDQLEKGSEPGVSSGIYTALSALEILLYPPSSAVVETNALTNQGVLEIVPPAAPLTLLFLGTNRAMPVKITRLQVTEEAFDARLNPIRASVAVSADVLSYVQLGLDSQGGSQYMTYQITKEQMAQQGTITGALFVVVRPGPGS